MAERNVPAFKKDIKHKNNYPKMTYNGKVREVHLVKAEKALGKPIPKRADVHHANGKKYDSRNSNLVICQDRKYHLLLHTRLNALRECGNPNWRRCSYCHQYDSPANLSIGATYVYHKECVKKYARSRKKTDNPNIGIHWDYANNKWSVIITKDRKKYRIGRYGDFDEAVCARLAAEQCSESKWFDEDSFAAKYVRNMLNRKD